MQADREERRNVRERLVKSFPYPTLERKHLVGTTLLPTRYDMLDQMPKNGCVCEIGVANGDFSNEICNRCLPSKFHLVDAWDSERYSPDYATVISRFGAEIESGVLEINKRYSTDRLPEFPDAHFDWIYVDSAHDYRITAQELELGLKKVRPGGIIAGHDYTVGNIVSPVPYGVIQAVQEFCINHNWK